MTRGPRRCLGAHVLAAALLLAPAAGFAQEPVAALPVEPLPVIREIVFEGNDTTQPRTLLREMVVHVGDAADPGAVERSRQAIQDLGLFKSVTAEIVPREDGAKVVIHVEEKFYVIPAPRVDWNSNGEYAYGLQLRWYNVFGLNHTLRFTALKSNKGQEGQPGERGVSTGENIGYEAPLVFGSRYSVSFASDHQATPVTDKVLPNTTYRETRDTELVGVGRSFNQGPASQGWSGGVTLSWANQRATLPQRQYGMATAIGLGASYQAMHFNIYSDQGISTSGQVATAHQGFLSDYDFVTISGNYLDIRYVGERPHQNLVFAVDAGTYHGGPSGALAPGRHQFTLGGAHAMRGFEDDFIEGDTYYHLAQEFLTPVGFAGSLRALLVVEEGNAFGDIHEASFDRVYTCVGLGLRVRPIWFVNLNLEAGVAWPVQRGAKARLFAGGFRGSAR